MVLSAAPWTKRSRRAQRQRAHVDAVPERAQDGAVVIELDGVVARAGERVLVVGQCHGAHHEGGEGVLEAVEEVHADGLVGTALRMRWPSARRTGKPTASANNIARADAGAHQALLATLHTLTRPSYAPLMIFCRRASLPQPKPRGGLEAVDERPVDVVQPDLAVLVGAPPRPTQCTPSGSAVRQSTMDSNSKMIERATERPQLPFWSSEPLRSALRPAAPPPHGHHLCEPGWCARTRRRAKS